MSNGVIEAFSGYSLVKSQAGHALRFKGDGVSPVLDSTNLENCSVRNVVTSPFHVRRSMQPAFMGSVSEFAHSPFVANSGYSFTWGGTYGSQLHWILFEIRRPLYGNTLGAGTPEYVRVELTGPSESALTWKEPYLSLGPTGAVVIPNLAGQIVIFDFVAETNPHFDRDPNRPWGGNLYFKAVPCDVDGIDVVADPTDKITGGSVSWTAYGTKFVTGSAVLPPARGNFQLKCLDSTGAERTSRWYVYRNQALFQSPSVTFAQRMKNAMQGPVDFTAESGAANVLLDPVPVIFVDAESCQQFSLTAAQVEQGQQGEYNLKVTEPETFRLYGQLLDQGNPQAGEVMTLKNAADETLAEVTTDLDGKFECVLPRKLDDYVKCSLWDSSEDFSYIQLLPPSRPYNGLAPGTRRLFNYVNNP